MQTEIWILILIACVSLTARLVVVWMEAKGETAEQRVYANWCEPIFIEQTFFGNWWQARAVEEYDYIVLRLKQHGNQYLDPDKDVHLFIHRFDVQNSILDFSDWQTKVKQDQQKIKHDFFLPKAVRAERHGDKAGAARFYAKAGMDFVKNANGEL